VLHFTFDDYDGANVVDQSGTGNDGTVHGATFETNGAIGGAYRFDGNDRIDVAHHASLTFGPDDAFTIAAWVKTTPSAHHQCIAMKSRSDTTPDVFGYELKEINTVGGFIAFDSGGTATQVNGTNQITDAVWHHVAVVYDRRDIRLYTDGMPDKTGRNTTVTSLLPDNEFVVGVGHVEDLYTDYLRGFIDDLRVYDRALSAAEVGELHAPSAGDGLVLHFTFDDYDGTNVVDQSGTGNDGAVYGATFESGGAIGGAYRFDGNDYIKVADDSTLHFLESNSFTMTTWVKTTPSGLTQVLCGKTRLNFRPPDIAAL